MTNYSFTTGQVLPTVENGHHFTDVNFAQAEPNTEIFIGKTGLIFEKCNLINCSIPGDAQKIDCLHIQKDMCANTHPQWVDEGFIDAEAENCSHVVDTDEITIDGVLVDTIYYYEDTIL